MNVVIYARYSSHNQTEQSIEGQIAVCQEFAKRNNYTIVGEYIDRALTGTNDNRPQFKKMIEDSNKKFFNGVLVYQLDRFARNRYDSATYKNKLKKNDVRVFSAKENISEDASGVLMESVLEGMAEYYSAELSQKVIRGMKINAEKCLYNGGIPPLGYKIDESKKFQIDEDNAKVVKKIFEMYSNGYIMADIIKDLNKKGIKTSYGNEFNKCSIRTILTNKKYIGVYCYKGQETKDGVPRIIDDETFEKVQEMMKKNKKAPARAKAKTEYLLTTKLFCGKCKEMMVGICGTSGTKQVHHYYACNGKRKRICDRKNIQKDLIEDLVVKYARDILTDENIEKIANAIVELAKKEKNNTNIKQLEKSLKEIEKQTKNLMDSLKICDIDSVRKSIFEEIAKMEEERKQIEIQIVIENSQQIEITKPQIKFFFNEMKNGNIEDIKYKKLLINVLIDKVYVYDDNITIIFNVQKQNDTTIKIPRIEEIESSFLGNNGQPNLKNCSDAAVFLLNFPTQIARKILLVIV